MDLSGNVSQNKLFSFGHGTLPQQQKQMTNTGFTYYISVLCPSPHIHTSYLPWKAQVSAALTSLMMQVCDLALEEDQRAGDAGGTEAEGEGDSSYT